MATLAALLVATAAGPAAGAPGTGRGQGQGKAVGQGNGKAVGQGNGKAIGQGNGNAIGQQPPPSVADPASNPAYALPPWNDAQWQSSEEYDTIQTADIDGDDRDELIGRDATGLQAWDFDLDTGQWTPLYVGGSGFFTDAQGWELKSQYETIGSGDVDGDGADEVFGRGPDGLEVYDFDASTASWIALLSPGEWTDVQAM